MSSLVQHQSVESEEKATNAVSKCQTIGTHKCKVEDMDIDMVALSASIDGDLKCSNCANTRSQSTAA